MRMLLMSSALMCTFGLVGFAQSGQKQGAFKLSKQEQQLLDLTNAERKKENLPPLKAAPQLFQMARSHSQNMAKQGKLDHDLDCKTPFDRLSDVMYDYQGAAENVAASAGELSMADLLKLWMDSDRHRANILSAKYTEIGLGIAQDEDGKTYGTQVFAVPFKK